MIKESERLTPPPDDPRWPKASAWIAGESFERTGSSIAIVGAPLNHGIIQGSYHEGPSAIRLALERYGSFDVEHNNDLRSICIEDLGDLDLNNKRPEDAAEPIGKVVADCFGRNLPLVLFGGDGGVTRAGIAGLPVDLKRVGLISLDAHFDVRGLESGLHSGNSVAGLLRDGMLGNHIVHIGIQDYVNSAEYAQIARDSGMHFVTAAAVFDDGIDRVMKDAFENLRDLDAIYFNLDLDVLDRAFAPAAPGSKPGGLMAWQLRRIAYLCGSHYNCRAMDIVELDPERDVSEITAFAAAACFLSFASGTIERREHK